MSRHDRTLAECNTDFKNATRRKQFPTFLPTETAFMVPPFVGHQPLSKQGKGERGPIKRFKFTPPLFFDTITIKGEYPRVHLTGGSRAS